jgi:UDP-N-acetylmuramate dehydrogenase
MSFLDTWAEVVKHQEPLAPYLSLRLGGPAQALMEPRSEDELAAVVRRCRQEKHPVKILGGGCNVLARDEGVPGLVVRLAAPAFTAVTVSGRTVRAGAGAALSAVISEAARHSLAGLESLIGIPGQVGGAVRSNAGTRAGHIGQVLRRLFVLDQQGQRLTIERDDLPVEHEAGGLDDYTILAAAFELDADNPDAILKRMRKFWIQKKAHQPLSFQATARLFRDPRGLSAEQLIEQAGLQGASVGGAALSEQNPNYVVVQDRATARDVLRLIDLVRTKVAEQLGQTLQLALVVW